MTTIAETKQKVLDEIHNSAGWVDSGARIAALASVYEALSRSEMHDKPFGGVPPGLLSGAALREAAMWRVVDELEEPTMVGDACYLKVSDGGCAVARASR